MGLAQKLQTKGDRNGNTWTDFKGESRGNDTHESTTEPEAKLVRKGPGKEAVVNDDMGVGRPPWIALAIAITFGVYGLLRKRSPLGPLPGLTSETLILVPLAGGFLLFLAAGGNGALGHGDLLTTALVISTGVVTAIPLLLFAKGARGLKLTTLGLLQYIAPTC